MSEHRPEREVVYEAVRLEGLYDVASRPPLGEYLAHLWQRRHFIRADARGRVVSGARATILGLGWLVLRPILDGAAYFVIFGLVLRTSRGIPNFIGYLIIGIFLFQFTARCLNSGASSLVAGKALVRAFAFPRAALPVATTVREVLSAVPMLGAMFALILLIPPQEEITWRYALFPLIFALQVVFSLGIGLAAARATARIPDLTHVIPVLTRLWLYGSAVFFSYDAFLENETVLDLLHLNPMYVVLDMSRDVLLYGVTPAWDSWVILTGWSLVAILGGLLFFWRGEETYGSL